MNFAKLAIVAALPLLSQVVGPPPPAVPLAPTTKLVWNAVTHDMTGKPILIAGYELAVSGAGVDLNAGGLPLRSIFVPQAVDTSIEPLVVGMQDGPVKFWLRAKSQAGNVSTWASLDAVLESAIPKMPTGLRIQVTVTVTAGQ